MILWDPFTHQAQIWLDITELNQFNYTPCVDWSPTGKHVSVSIAPPSSCLVFDTKMPSWHVFDVETVTRICSRESRHSCKYSWCLGGHYALVWSYSFVYLVNIEDVETDIPVRHVVKTFGCALNTAGTRFACALLGGVSVYKHASS